MFLCGASVKAFAAENERVTAVLPDNSIQLETSGKASFANIRYPDGKLAQNWLTGHLLQQEINVDLGDTDRYGRIVITSDCEEKMLRDGIAIFYASDGSIPASWFAAEAAARRQKAGVWVKEDWVVTPQNAAQHKNEFHVVEGAIMHIYNAKAATYLNFGKNWHSDFSVTIPAKLRRSMHDKLTGFEEGDMVRVRGRLYEENGPMILLNHADNLEHD